MSSASNNFPHTAKNSPPSSIVWFRQDLRIQDNPALQSAIDLGLPIIPLYILEDESTSDWPLGGASKWWLYHTLKDLSASLNTIGLSLIFKKGDSLQILKTLLKQYNIKNIFWNRRYQPHHIVIDKNIKESLKNEQVDVVSFNGSLLFEPHQIQNKQNKPFQVFTPFWKHCLTQPIPQETQMNFDGILKHPFPQTHIESDNLDSWYLLPTIPWDKNFYQAWNPTFTGGCERLNNFINQHILQYDTARDIPGIDGTSRLSPYLHFGQLSPKMIWWQVDKISPTPSEGKRRFLAEIGWREFGHHLLFHFPHTVTQPLQSKFLQFPWINDPLLLDLWKKGHTGYPIVDAGMRQLWQTGWMHNRLRMIVASFLVKHLQIHWLEGAKWFWDTLVDADLASNTLGWQWSAGCGADAAPYFRIFNPGLQSLKFDPEGSYIKEFIPELSKLPPKYIHAPWEAPPEILHHYNVHLGDNYPHPIVNHEFARDRALNAFKELTD